MLATGAYSALAGGVALAVLMLPTVMLTAEEAIRMVPRENEGCRHRHGLHATQVIWKVVLPTALPGILTGVMLAVARPRRDGAAALHRALQQLLAVRAVADAADRLAGVLIYNFSEHAVREPDRARLGGLARARADRARRSTS